MIVDTTNGNDNLDAARLDGGCVRKVRGITTVRIHLPASEDRIVRFRLDHGPNTRRRHMTWERWQGMRYLLFSSVAAAALAATGSGTAASVKTVNGTVGPGFTIALTMDGKNITKLNADVPYRLVISDRARYSRFPSERTRLQSRSHERGVRRNEELHAAAEEGELQLRLRPAFQHHARPLPGFLARNCRGRNSEAVAPTTSQVLDREIEVRAFNGLTLVQ